MYMYMYIGQQMQMELTVKGVCMYLNLPPSSIVSGEVGIESLERRACSNAAG